MRDHFKFRKENQLAKIDKSFKGKWDDKIINLCEKINLNTNYYTNSSCSGRVVLIKSSNKKTKDLFIETWHDIIDFDDLKKVLENIKTNELIYLKQDPVILHVSCRNLQDAQELIDLASTKAGWKRCSIITTNKRFVVELNSTEKLEFPIFHNKLLVSDDYLRLIVEEANIKLEKSWEKIRKLEKII